MVYNPNADFLIADGGDQKKGLNTCLQNSEGEKMLLSLLNLRLDGVDFKALSTSQNIDIEHQVMLEFYESSDGGWFFRKDSYFNGEGFQATRLSWKQLLPDRWNIMLTIGTSEL
jgi:hypothetical protein